MQRHISVPRPDWKKQCEDVGLFHHTPGGEPYWNEEAYYSLSMAEVEAIESATNELHAMCLDVVDHVIETGRFEEFHIPEQAIPLIHASWNANNGDGDPSIYGRFDLIVKDGSVKMLEYNADTPTSLVEASVAQWHWLQSKFPNNDQFNSIHEKLVGYWTHLRPYLMGPLYFMSQQDAEDIATINYLRDTAGQAGIQTRYLPINELGVNEHYGVFVYEDGQVQNHIKSAFKLYPWEWMVHEAYSDLLVDRRHEMQWIEPAWKMILSNKMILPVLWERFPGHPNLLPAYTDEYFFTNGEYVRKPLLSREGANVKIVSGWDTGETSGEYGEEGYIYQEYFSAPDFNGIRPVIGSWVIGGESAGVGIRESHGPITDNMSRFVPHLIS